MKISRTSQVFISKGYFNIIPIHRFQGNKNVFCRVDFTRVAKQAIFWHEQNKKLPGHKQAKKGGGIGQKVTRLARKTVYSVWV